MSDGKQRRLLVASGALRAGLPVIESEFGKEWLLEQVARHKTKHPVVRAWKEVRAIVERLDRGESVEHAAEHVAVLLDAARLLGRAKLLPNYESAIKKRLWDPDFAHLHYELQVAVLAADRGYTVEFVPPSAIQGVRIPDLRVSTASGAILAECKRKDSYEVASFDYGLWPELERSVVRILDALGADYEVIVVALGPLRREDEPAILAGVREAAARGFEGGPLAEKGVDKTLFLRKLALPPPSPQPGITVVPGKNRRGTRFADIYRGADGLFYTRSNRGVWLYTIDSHRLAGIVASFNKARQQLSQSEPGAIYIDVDVGSVPRIDLPFYLESVGAALRTLFSPTLNTRVAAVIVTITGILAPLETAPDTFVYSPDTPYVTVRNPYFPGGAPPSIPFDPVEPK